MRHRARFVATNWRRAQAVPVEAREDKTELQDCVDLSAESQGAFDIRLQADFEESECATFVSRT